MAGFYVTANLVKDLPRSNPVQEEIQNAIQRWGLNGWPNAAEHLEQSLRLDPGQVHASLLRGALPDLRSSGIPVDHLQIILELLVVSPP
jgi:hypothetical protein